MNSPSIIYAVYIGPSMNPTLKEPDLLEIMPYKDGMVQVGDIIFFSPPEKSGFVVHRVTRVTPPGIFTRGDNNSRHDTWCLQEKDIRGRVIAAWHDHRRREIVGGWKGQLILLWLPCGRFFNRLGAYMGRRVKFFGIKPGQLAWILPSHIQPRVFFFQVDDSPQAYILWGKQIVGRFDLKQNCWIIRLPFRWFIPQKILSLTPHL